MLRPSIHVDVIVATMRIIRDDSVLDPEHAPTCQLYPRAGAHPRLQAKNVTKRAWMYVNQ